ncbi:MAG: enoyl-CoA hydratase/isomerase family protein [Phycisphaerae bacterium]|nr:enoyl-CoA hydratase/isomerase family protein [Phycisphaerae bacterium]
MSSGTQIELRVDGLRATITFHTENGINVMSLAVLNRLGEVVEELGRQKDVRFCVLKAIGKVFIAGANIKEMAGYTPEDARNLCVRGNAVMDALAGLPCVTVAAINGAALGGGCEISLACDFRIAASSAKIGLPETNLGLIPGWGGIGRMARVLGVQSARRLVFGGVPISAQQALECGLVDEVVDSPENLDPTVEKLFKSLVRGGPRAIGLAKRVLLGGDEPQAFGECFAGDESREGMGAFVEKRAAAWMEG